MELRLDYGGVLWEQTQEAGQSTDTSGSGDMGIGTKIYFWEFVSCPARLSQEATYDKKSSQQHKVGYQQDDG